ncbi:BQ2448_3858 [Microbotryum intermedium]|uniref:BQ2448_3858 protein n=1 Tax=Microbotryum intermedium TaxID=269621 RepID=A0A238FJJ0_9BASI|nr:BQ2448_3858 [Microbotryum intermedium]
MQYFPVMLFLPIFLVASVIAIQTSSPGLSASPTTLDKCPNLKKSCPSLEKSCVKAEIACKKVYKLRSFDSLKVCISELYPVYGDQSFGSVCDWAKNAPVCMQQCMNLEVNWCDEGHMPKGDNNSLCTCCKRECCAERQIN